jgi:hypothetical protein
MEPVVLAVIVLIAGIALVAALAPRFGADSRSDAPSWPGGAAADGGWRNLVG